MKPENRELQTLLAHLYDRAPQATDCFGRRPANPAEIERAIRQPSEISQRTLRKLKDCEDKIKP